MAFFGKICVFGQFSRTFGHFNAKGRCQNILRGRGVLKMEGATTSIKNGVSVDEFGTFLWGAGSRCLYIILGRVWMTSDHLEGEYTTMSIKINTLNAKWKGEVH